MIFKYFKYLKYALFALCFAAGWLVCTWYEDSKDLAVKNAQEAILKAMRQTESEYAKTLEENLARLKANERVIEKFEREVVERPVYRNVCIDDDGLRIIDSYRLGDTAELIGEMPGNATGSDGN